MKTVFNQENTLYKENQDEIKQKINKYFLKNINIFNKYINPKKEKECAVCGSKDFTKFINQFRSFSFWDNDFNDIGLHYYHDLQFKLHNEFLLICNNCKLIFSEFKLNQEFYEDYFKVFEDQSSPLNFDDNTLKIDKLYSTEKNNIRFEIIENYLSLNSKILEISSYRGWGLNDMVAKFDVYGIEPNLPSYKFCVHNFPKLKEKIHYGLFEKSKDFLSIHGKFDGVIFSQCFRHIPDPRFSLKLLDNITNENSLVIVDESLFLDTIYFQFKNSSRTIESLNESFIHGKKFYYSTHHLISLFKEFGFELINKYNFDSKKVDGLQLDLLVFKKNDIEKTKTENIQKEMVFMEDFLKIFDKNYDDKRFYKFSINSTLIDKLKLKLGIIA